MLLHYTPYFIKKLVENNYLINDENQAINLLSISKNGLFKKINERVILLYLPTLNGEVIVLTEKKKLYALTFIKDVIKNNRPCEVEWVKGQESIDKKLATLEELVLAEL